MTLTYLFKDEKSVEDPLHNLHPPLAWPRSAANFGD